MSPFVKHFSYFVILAFTACGNGEDDCIIPPCAQPNLNAFSSLKINFCTSGDDCFTVDELAEITFSEIAIETEELIRLTEITNLEENGFSLNIGNKSNLNLPDFLFGPEPSGSTALATPVYFYEIDIPQLGRKYRIENLVFQPSEECSCPNYNFASLSLASEIVEVIDNTITLKKEN